MVNVGVLLAGERRRARGGLRTGRDGIRDGAEGRTMKCDQCGGDLDSRRENYLYEESRYRGVTLLDIEVRRCGGCGDFEVVIPRIEELHRLLAATMSRNPRPACVHMKMGPKGWRQAA
ncbi:MAG: YgiT-type zinc finger protein [Acidobacteria bacterium]|nr:YgiT-type zinc finger protein [Acidobacteriota bacterium]